MNRLWVSDDWGNYFEDEDRRVGLRFRFDKMVDEDVKRSCKKFAKWLRRNYVFPMRVPLYIRETKFIRSVDGDMASASFFGPYDKTLEPYIRVAAGDYEDLLKKMEREDALASILVSISHELSHYFQWIKDIELSDDKMERQAKYYARKIVWDYLNEQDVGGNHLIDD